MLSSGGQLGALGTHVQSGFDVDSWQKFVSQISKLFLQRPASANRTS